MSGIVKEGNREAPCAPVPYGLLGRTAADLQDDTQKNREHRDHNGKILHIGDRRVRVRDEGGKSSRNGSLHADSESHEGTREEDQFVFHIVCVISRQDCRESRSGKRHPT